jgi:hypothetical protein
MQLHYQSKQEFHLSPTLRRAGIAGDRKPLNALLAGAEIVETRDRETLGGERAARGRHYEVIVLLRLLILVESLVRADSAHVGPYRTELHFCRMPLAEADSRLRHAPMVAFDFSAGTTASEGSTRMRINSQPVRMLIARSTQAKCRMPILVLQFQ